jgi:hypothetical protein
LQAVEVEVVLALMQLRVVEALALVDTGLQFAQVVQD